MKSTTILFLAITAAAFAGPANAIFKCTTPKGIVYQDRPCRDGNETDVTIVIPTGEMAPRPSGATEDGVQPSSRADDRAVPARAQRNAGDRSEPAGKLPDRRNGEPTATPADATQKRGVPMVMEKVAPMTTEEARKTDPSAKYYATEGFGAGSSDTPSRMNCESPTGEKRIFYLSNGKLTSI
jgi:hypothetical protein